jgi:hypothetical protein
MNAYADAIEFVVGQDVDYAQIVKTYGTDESKYSTPERKYSPSRILDSEKIWIQGRPEGKYVSTSYVERLNATSRLHMKRLNRLTLAFSKKFENFQAAVSLHFAAYNLVRTHSTLKMTPAIAAGVETNFWSSSDLVEAVL